MFVLTHPSHALDMKTVKASKADIINYLGSEELFNQFVSQGLIYADNTIKDKGADSKSNTKSEQSDRGDK